MPIAPNRNARVSPALARLAIEAREAATQADAAAKLARAEASSPEQVAQARKEATEMQSRVEAVEGELHRLESINEVEHKNYSTARMDANRLRANREQAETDCASAEATAQKLAALLDTAQSAFADATAKKEGAEEFAASKWDEASSAAERAGVLREAAEQAADESADAARQAAAAEARRLGCESKLAAADRERQEAVADVTDMAQKRDEAMEAVEKATRTGEGGARAAWEKRQAQQTADAMAEGLVAAEARVQRCIETVARHQKSLQEAVDAEGPIKARAAEFDAARLEAQAQAQQTDLDAKNADAAARKAEQAARVARAAYQGAETKLGRELPAKEAADEAAAKAIEALEAARARSEAASQKEIDCEATASSAKAACELKQAERQTLTTDAKAKDAVASELEAKEAAAAEAEALATKLELDATAAEARQYDVGKMLTETSSVAKMCETSGEGLHMAQAGQRTTFQIEARDINGDRQPNGGDNFFVSIRYSGQGTRVRATVLDHDDGTYIVAFKPESTGRVTISVSLSGETLPGSPFTCNVRAPQPCASSCRVSGGALTKVVAGNKEVFTISFRDELGQLTSASELDVCVLPARDDEIAAAREEAEAEAEAEAVAGGRRREGLASPLSNEDSDGGGSFLAGRWASDFVGGGEVDEGLIVVTTPLDLTLTADASSKWLGKVQPGRVVRVLRTEAVGDEAEGIVRAMVALEDMQVRAALQCPSRDLVVNACHPDRRLDCSFPIAACRVGKRRRRL